MTEDEWDERAEWVIFGVAKGWISEQYCAVHDSDWDYYTPEEQADIEEGGDPCAPVFRILNT
jgi:hypothetical protein